MDPDVDGRIIVKWTYILQGSGLGSNGSREGSVVGRFEDGNEPSGFIKFGELLDQLGDYQLLKK
jgi:hypothetical protein